MLNYIKYVTKRLWYGFKGSFPYFGTKVYFPQNSHSFRSACFQGIFEGPNVHLLTSLARPGTYCLDVGANIGLMAVPVLKAVDGVSIASFEASPNVLNHLSRTIKESAYGPRWTLVPKAVGAVVGKTEFNLSSKANSVYDGIKSTHRVPTVGQVEVEMTTIDHWWNEAGRPEISVIKCDVEGADLLVLEGAKGCLAKWKPPILIEWQSENIRAYNFKSSALLDYSREAGYDLYAWSTMLVKVNSAIELDIQMVATESFLLLPHPLS